MRLRVVALQTVRKKCSPRPGALRTRRADREPAQLARTSSTRVVTFSLADIHTPRIFRASTRSMPTGGGMGPCILPLPTTIISLDLLVLSLRLLVSAHCWTPKSSSCTVCLMLDPTIKYVSSANFTKMVCIDSEFGTTGYINVHVSHKTITGVINGAFSQKVGGLLKYICSSHLKSTQKF